MNIKLKVILFAAAFFLLQVIDLGLTAAALKDPRYSELNPFYAHSWFVWFKLSAIFLIAPLMYHCLMKAPRIGNMGIIILLGMYVLICANNAILVIL